MRNLISLSGVQQVAGAITTATGLQFGNVLDFFGVGDTSSIINDASSDIVWNTARIVGADSVTSTITNAGGLTAVLNNPVVGGLISVLGSLLGGGSEPCGYSGIPGIPLGSIGSPIGFFPPSVLHVPVKDFEAEGYLRTIMGNTFVISQNTLSIVVNTAISQRHLDTIRGLLLDLCQKEYVRDPQLQHAWAEVIGEFVRRTHQFVLTAYAANPIFISSQTIYYKLVDDAIYETFKKEIRDSDIGKATKNKLLKTLERERFESLFPYDWGNVEWAPEDLPDELIKDFEAAGGWIAWARLFLRPEINEQGLTSIVQREFARRRERGLAYEQEKLAWGRGFFSYENCDLEIYTDIRTDRRNCRIVTPGALIQDEVSLVFGTAIRQMEEADEIDEWVAANSIAVLNDILNWNGLNSDRSRKINSLQNRGRDPVIPPIPVPPGNAKNLIETGTMPPRNKRFPTEFDRAFEFEFENVTP